MEHSFEIYKNNIAIDSGKGFYILFGSKRKNRNDNE